MPCHLLPSLILCYGVTVEALLQAGAKAPALTEEMTASPAVREVLRRLA